MVRLALMLFTMIATSLAGTGVIAVLSAGYDTWPAILASAAIGFVLAIPASVYVAKKIQDNML